MQSDYQCKGVVGIPDQALVDSEDIRTDVQVGRLGSLLQVWSHQNAKMLTRTLDVFAQPSQSLVQSRNHPLDKLPGRQAVT
jgi:hypothetical protein